MDFLYNKAYENLYKNKDSAIYYFNRMEDEAGSKHDIESIIDAHTGVADVSEYHHDLTQSKKTFKTIDSIFIENSHFISTLPENLIYHVHLAYQKGNYFYTINSYDKAREHYNDILARIEVLPSNEIDNDLLIYRFTARSYLAKMYSDEGKLDLAKDYYEQNIRDLKGNTANDKFSLFRNYDLLAEVLKRKKSYQRANTYLLQSLDYYVKTGEENSSPTVLNIVQNHNSLGQIDSAEHYLKIAKNLLQKNDLGRSDYHQVNAETFEAKGNYSKAATEFEESLQLIREKWDGKKHWEIAHVLNKLGQLHQKFGHSEKAVKSYDLALAQLSGSNTAIDRNKKVEILRNKAKTLTRIESKPNYAAAAIVVNQGVALLDSLKPSFKSHTDKLSMIENAFPLFESGLTATYERYRETGEEKFIDQAFYYSEKSKSVLLMEALLASKATEFADIPNELMERDDQLKAEITQIEKQIATTNEGTSLQDDLFSRKKEHRKLIETIEAEYPAYYRLKYDSSVISLTEAQEFLANGEALVCYFYGNEAIYVISISKDEKAMHMVPVDADLSNEITEIHGMLADPQSDVSDLANKTNALYKRVLEPSLKSEKIERLVIITDGLLNYIPFGAMNMNSEELHYLTEQFAVSYANSATLLSKLKRQRPAETSKILAFAPSFDGSGEVSLDRSKLLPLPHNKKEISGIMNSFAGNSYSDKEASLTNFRKELGGFNILHLATHAIFDDAMPEYSYLAFAQKGGTTNESALFVADLYNLRTGADLVTLSACESGIGELKRGEGFLSLARGFFYSGAAGIASTLWKVNDASSSQLMNTFYAKLSEGEAKDVALQGAKLEFLSANRQNGRSHPYYWSGFVISGNTSPLISNNIWAWISMTAAVLLAIGGLLYFTKRRKYHS